VLIGYGILREWHWSPLLIALEYAPFYAWLAWDMVRGEAKLDTLVARSS